MPMTQRAMATAVLQAAKTRILAYSKMTQTSPMFKNLGG